MPSLYRESDGAGDRGSMSDIFKPSACGAVDRKPGRPTMGYCVRVGTPYGRTFADQDYWTTTPVTEILEETEDRVRFKTRSGSTYVWKA